MKSDYATPGCHGKDIEFNKLVKFYQELGGLKREFKKRLNWELNDQGFINCNKKNGVEKYFLHIKKLFGIKKMF